ncbi:MAG: GT-D fold domain-containing glycosyltransferase [Candidatus Saccharibacteria bacterium]|nr:GT-D fold domain-containing glycosyltransferase [Candidatus Saccharibacteria bacterium]
MKNKISRFFKPLIYTFERARMPWNPGLEIMSDEDTINDIVVKHKSLARFGEGEFKWIFMDDEAPAFQRNSLELSERLTKAFSNMNKNLLVCIPANMFNHENQTLDSKMAWVKFVNKYWVQIRRLVNLDYRYGNAGVMSPCKGYMDQWQAGDRFKNLKRIWDEKNVLVVEGETSKIGVENDLLHNAKNVDRIEYPEKNAFAKIDDIYKDIMRKMKVHKYDIVLLTLGPTASILVSELTNAGIQAVDVGELDAEFERYAHAREEIIERMENEK